MPRDDRSQPIDPASCAQSIITLLDQLRIERLPAEEQEAVIAVETKALETWLSSCPLPFAGDHGCFHFPPDAAEASSSLENVLFELEAGSTPRE